MSVRYEENPLFAVAPTTILGFASQFALDNGQIRPMSVKVGDKVLFGQYSGNTVKIDGEEVVILSETELYGVIE